MYLLLCTNLKVHEVSVTATPGTLNVAYCCSCGNYHYQYCLYYHRHSLFLTPTSN